MPQAKAGGDEGTANALLLQWERSRWLACFLCNPCVHFNLLKLILMQPLQLVFLGNFIHHGTSVVVQFKSGSVDDSLYLESERQSRTSPYAVHWKVSQTAFKIINVKPPVSLPFS